MLRFYENRVIWDGDKYLKDIKGCLGFAKEVKRGDNMNQVIKILRDKLRWYEDVANDAQSERDVIKYLSITGEIKEAISLLAKQKEEKITEKKESILDRASRLKKYFLKEFDRFPNALFIPKCMWETFIEELHKTIPRRKKTKEEFSACVLKFGWFQDGMEIIFTDTYFGVGTIKGGRKWIKT